MLQHSLPSGILPQREGVQGGVVSVCEHGTVEAVIYGSFDHKKEVEQIARDKAHGLTR